MCCALAGAAAHPRARGPASASAMEERFMMRTPYEPSNERCLSAVGAANMAAISALRCASLATQLVNSIFGPKDVSNVM